MQNIIPISDLRDYNKVLKHCVNGEPVFLTKNGRGAFVLIDIQEYEFERQVTKLLTHLAESEARVAKGEPTMTVDELARKLRLV